MTAASSLDPREIRLALALNGGVSLAVWIGGVVAEIDRARRAGLSASTTDPVVEMYRMLLTASNSVLRTDVITGASAGGLNGCLLAAAVATDGKVDDVRDTWIQLGSFRSLLRSGMEPDPPSILKGDEYFLVEMEREFGARLRVPTSTGPHSRVGLFVTGTDLLGEPVRHYDDFGATIVDREHRALFQFRHDPQNPGASNLAATNARAISRVARTTASFPGAFEASFCRVGEVDGGNDYVDVAKVASFSTSRWVIDGGVLDNAPLGPAIGAIGRAPAGGRVRRLLCYVTPYASPEGDPASDLQVPPSMAAVVGAAFNLPRDLTFTETLERLESYRDRVRRRRRGRESLLTMNDASLRALASDMFSTYCRGRLQSSAEDVVQRLLEKGTGSRDAGHSTQRPLTSIPRLLNTPRQLILPWVPQEPNGFDAAVAAPDSWGLAPISRAAHSAIDLFSQVLDITPHDLAPDAQQRLFTVRTELSVILNEVYGVRDRYLHEARSITDSSLPLGDTTAKERRLLETAVAVYTAHSNEPGWPTMKSVAERIATGAINALLLLDTGPPGLAPSRRARLRPQVERLAAAEGTDALVGRLLCVETIQEGLSPTTDHDQDLSFIRINAEAPCELDGRNRPEEKLTGLGLAHFGGFYKRSWRANDWMWGRLDGASRLVDILLEPAGLRLAMNDVNRQTIAALAADGTPEVTAAATATLDELAGWNLEGQPPDLTPLRDAIRRKLQLAIAQEELPIVAAMALDDPESEDSSPDAFGVGWARAHQSKLDSPEGLVAAIRSLRIAERESVMGELGSNLLTRNAATVAAVAASALSGKQSGLPSFLRYGLRTARGLLLAVYALTWGLTSRRTAAKSVSVLALLIAAAVVAMGIAGSLDGGGPAGSNGVSDVPTWLSGLAALVIAAGLVLGVIRGGWSGVVVGLAFAVAYVTLVVHDNGGLEDGFRELVDDHTVLALVLAVSALGALAGLVVRRDARCFAWRSPIWRRAVLVAFGGVLAAIIVTALWLAVDRIHIDESDLPWNDWGRTLGAIVVGLVVLGALWYCAEPTAATLALAVALGVGLWLLDSRIATIVAAVLVFLGALAGVTLAYGARGLPATAARVGLRRVVVLEREAALGEALRLVLGVGVQVHSTKDMSTTDPAWLAPPPAVVGDWRSAVVTTGPTVGPVPTGVSLVSVPRMFGWKAPAELWAAWRLAKELRKTSAGG